MKTKTINIYTIDELNQKAQEKALSNYIENNDYQFLSEDLNERLHELLEENNIKDLNDTSKAGTKPTPVYYSLSYSQGDGACFEGSFEWKGYNITIKQSGRYYHSNSKDIDFNIDMETYQDAETLEKDEEEFETIYQKICKTLEKYGYDFIEYQDSMENFKENCNTNEWTFLADGTLENY
jgi:hypothetical protein